MSKHIDGPLQVGYEFDETGYPLFVVAGLSGDQKRDRPTLEATAKLFTAAPELLEAAKRALNYCINSQREVGIVDGSDEELDSTKLLRAAIAKATE